MIAPTPGRGDSRRDIEALINTLVGDSRPGSTGGAASPATKGSRPNSVLSAGEISNETSEFATAASAGQVAQTQQQPPPPPPALTTIPLETVFECPPSPVKEVFSYSKGVQTTEEWMQTARPRATSMSDNEDLPGTTSTPSKRMSRRERDREEELRQNIRQEVEDELKAAREALAEGGHLQESQSSNYPLRKLTDEELGAVTASPDFGDFLDKSTKVIERALDEEYDILTDYANVEHDVDDADDESGNTGGRGKRRVKEVAQFFDERWSKKRMISSIGFSPFHPEASAGFVHQEPYGTQRPRWLGASLEFEPTRPTRVHLPCAVRRAHCQVFALPQKPHRGWFVQRPGSPLGHESQIRPRPEDASDWVRPHTPCLLCRHHRYTKREQHHLVFNGWCRVRLEHGRLCTAAGDARAQGAPLFKIEDVSPTTLGFPQADPTFFLVGTEEGTIFPCHRYDRAGAKAGIDSRFSYKGHTAPVMSVDFHPARGPVDLGDLVLSSSLDWSVRLWKVRAPAATSAAGGEGTVSPLIDFVREDVVYDARWSPIKPGVFSLVDGAGWLELWDMTVETEEPVARITPSARKDGRTMLSKSLNKVAWEPSEGKRLATGGIDGTLTVFEVSSGLGGKDQVKAEEWTNVKKLISRIEAVGVNGAVAV